MSRATKLKLFGVIGFLVYILWANLNSEVTQKLRACNENADKNLPFGFTYGMSKVDVSSHIKEMFPHQVLVPTSENIEFVELSHEQSPKYNALWFGYKRDMLVNIWIFRRIPNLQFTEHQFETLMRTWLSEFEQKQGVLGVSESDEDGNLGKVWVSPTGELIKFVISLEGVREEFNCRSIIDLVRI